ncbi:MAG: TIGR04282 family arsenosugar biosynthesis glycosyltransferase [Planctomycetes bacterium]|nr:TIGR04282 family arsenosugar biosynthesis glycosyltransferase [Planctomycetota bacterium]MBI3846126.1 TIGR04282 family arsenosugar biosynthesis glycosyltransferase [Planctomycetota bacterium]
MAEAPRDVHEEGEESLMASEALVLVAKEPVKGKVKTRLCPPLTPELAADLYRAFLEDLLGFWSAPRPFARFVAYTPAESRPYFERLTPAPIRCIPQEGPGLAERLNNLSVRLLGEGFERVVITNTDSPHLPESLVIDAFAHLRAGDHAVFAPDEGGGYCLVGLREPHPELFLGIVMSTRTVIDETLEAGRKHGLRVSVLAPCRDIDDVADLEWFLDEMRRATPDVLARVNRTLKFLETHPLPGSAS